MLGIQSRLATCKASASLTLPIVISNKAYSSESLLTSFKVNFLFLKKKKNQSVVKISCLQLVRMASDTVSIVTTTKVIISNCPLLIHVHLLISQYSFSLILLNNHSLQFRIKVLTLFIIAHLLVLLLYASQKREIILLFLSLYLTCLT